MKTAFAPFSLCVTLLISLLLSLPNAASAEDEFDVRNVRWGMNKSDVTQAEGGKSPWKTAGDIVFYKDIFLNNQCDIGYKFDNNSLTDVAYIFSNLSRDKLKNIFMSISEYLDEEYEMFKIQDEFFSDFAIFFETERTRISLLSDDNKKRVSLVYTEISVAKKD